MTMDSERVANALLPLLRAALGSVDVRRAQDKSVGLLLKGTVFGLVSDGVLMFRVDARTRSDYEAAEAAHQDDATERLRDPLAGSGGGALTMVSFRRVPTFVLNDEDTLAEWGRKAWEAAKRARAGDGSVS